MNKNHIYLVAFIVITVIFGTIYIVGQQIQRNDANNPQIQIAEDLANQLNNHIDQNSINNTKINLNHSLDTFTEIYDKKGNIIKSNAILNNSSPIIPIGALKFSESSEYSAISWQPYANKRFATIIVSSNNNYILVARSLKIIEKNETQTLFLSGLGWLLSIGVVGLIAAIDYKVIKK